MHENGTINKPIYVLCYTPNTSIIKDIVSMAATQLSLAGVRAYNSPEDMEYDLLEHNYIAGVEFDSNDMDTSRSGKYPTILRYALRFPSELRTAQGPVVMNWQTDRLFPESDPVGPRNDDFDDGGVPVGYIAEGFLPIQHALTMSWLKLAAATKLSAEKEAQLKEIMKILGLQNWIHWVSWFIITYISILPVFVFLNFYLVASFCFTCMVAVFFNRATTATAVIGIVTILTFVPSFAVFHLYEKIDLVSKLALCLIFPNTAIGIGIYAIFALENSGEGLQWSNFFRSISIDDSLSIFLVCLMLAIGSVIFMLVCLYVEQIYPGNYGVPRKWNYLFQRKIWQSLLGLAVTSPGESGSSSDISGEIKRCTCRPKSLITDDAAQHGIQIQNLRKRYGDAVAVKDLSLNMSRNEITVLLGHNGAGKTTTIQMLTGTVAPTSGTAIINGCDIRTQLRCVRSSLGICPQQNVLFNEMSVHNHLVFFSRVKGLKGYELNNEVDKYLKIMGLEEKKNVAISMLSGGMKRKVSVCCSLCGNTKTVLCDEPSSGLDVSARRHLWDLLRSQKPGRTILLTTHYMDEADALADHIAIMSNGQLQCHGTSFSLKRQYGFGYRLVCIKQPDCDVEQVTAFLAKHIPDIRPESELGRELIYRLPVQHTSVFADILSDLEKKSNKLHLDGYGVSVATLEDVLQQVGGDNKREVGGHGIKTNHNRLPSGAEEVSVFDTDVYESSSRTRCLMRWRAMFMKKALTTQRSYWLLILQLVLPIIYMGSIVAFVSKSEASTLPPMHVSLKNYPSAYVVLEDKSGETTKPISVAYANYIGYQGGGVKLLSTSGADFEEYILDVSKEKLFLVDKEYVAGATISESNLTVWLNNKPFHTAPLTLNILHNALARHLLDSKAEIDVTHAPLPYTERNTRSKLLQYMSGVGVVLYWISHLLWDYAILVLTAILGIITVALFQLPGYSTLGDISRNLTVFLFFGISALPFIYLISNWFVDPASGYSYSSSVCMMLGPLLYMIIQLFFGDPNIIQKAILATARLFPHYCLAEALSYLYINFNLHKSCSNPMLTRLTHEDLCKFVPACCNVPGYFAWRKHGIMVNILFFLGSGTLYLLYIMLLDAKKCECLPDLLKGTKRQEAGQNSDPDDVDIERSTVANLTEAERNDLPLVVDRIKKKFGKFVAVKELSFYVAPGECFGLLGVNGAGKTTTFKMLTGDIRIGSGTAYVEGINLQKHMSKVYDRIGYCPQFDAVIGELTGRETMRFYCMLRGVQRKYIKTVCEDLAIRLLFIQHIQKPIKHYSGGSKRKLSLAISLINNPSVLYLDEPSAGMDPGARRQMWNLLTEFREHGKAVVLTSHCMEEVEALCMRVAIMVDGEFKCIGTTQTLKNKYSKGFVLKIRVKEGGRSTSSVNQGLSTDSDVFDCDNCTGQTDLVKKFIAHKLPESVLEEEFQGQLTYFIPIESSTWSKIFKIIENNSTKLNIEDYAITQTTLDEIFLELDKTRTNI
ncbi:ATP-binding cassette sub-family A member 2-like [Scaptodrosophila lebanonensis]|uniref:ATP-binding cassette sub-family A member 2-like n=1 Tax=Drosophila lebanonensis TaxID=7225 RepID=A0A6J2T4Y9_DROLE|nr:ATP-binding cassette sub-family A member 2-like [Scaptodrosophila lebanonensis]